MKSWVRPELYRFFFPKIYIWYSVRWYGMHGATHRRSGKVKHAVQCLWSPWQPRDILVTLGFPLHMISIWYNKNSCKEEVKRCMYCELYGYAESQMIIAEMFFVFFHTHKLLNRYFLMLNGKSGLCVKRHKTCWIAECLRLLIWERPRAS